MNSIKKILKFIVRIVVFIFLVIYVMMLGTPEFLDIEGRSERLSFINAIKYSWINSKYLS